MLLLNTTAPQKSLKTTLCQNAFVWSEIKHYVHKLYANKFTKSRSKFNKPTSLFTASVIVIHPHVGRGSPEMSVTRRVRLFWANGRLLFIFLIKTNDTADGRVLNGQWGSRNCGRDSGEPEVNTFSNNFRRGPPQHRPRSRRIPHTFTPYTIPFSVTISS